MALSQRLLAVVVFVVAIWVPVLVVPAQTVVVEQAEEPAAIELKAATVPAPPGPFDGHPGRHPPGMPPKPGPEAKEKPSEEGGKPEAEKGKPEGEKGKPGDKEKEKEQETPKPVQRPTEPTEPADPEELKAKPDDDGKIRFNFTGQKWRDVLQWLADVSEMSLDWQELPGDYLNLTTQRGYTVEEARDLINRHLLARGYTMICQGELLSVFNTKKLNPSMVPRIDPEELAERNPHEFVRVSFPLNSLVAQSLVEELKPMLSPNGNLTPLGATNRLEAMDAAINLREIHRLLSEEQSLGGQKGLPREFRLQHTRASEVCEQLQALLGLPSKPTGRPRPMTPQQMQQMQQQAAMMAQMKAQQGKKSGTPPKPSAPPSVTLVVNPRRNSILVNAPPDKMALIARAILAIDVPSDRPDSIFRNKDRMQVYRLENLDPDVLIRTLEDLGQLDFDTRLEADGQHQAVIAYASLADHLLIHTLVQKLDGGGRSARVIQLTRLRAASVAQTIDFMMGGGREEEDKESESRSRRYVFPFFGGYDRDSSRRSRRPEDRADQFRVDADVQNNRLLLWCNEFENAKVEQLLEYLREMPEGGRGPSTPKVYHLVTLDPEPFVKSLEEMETLDFYTRLEVDKENNAIIAFASEADHAKINDLITKLDGSSREFHVIQLRRLEADYVAGTIQFMMVGMEEKQSSGYSRTYVYNEYYGSGPSRGGREKKPDEFRVDADVEYNKLLLWANSVELEEVKNLLVKLGELPPEGGDQRTIRVLDVLPGPERQRMLEHIRRIWPSLAPNPLLTPPPEQPEEEKEEADQKEPEDEAAPVESRPTTAASGLVPPGTPEAQQPDSGHARVARAKPGRSVFRLAQLQLETPPPEASPNVQPQPAPSGDPGKQSAEPAAADPPSSNAAPGDGAGKPAPVSISQAPDGRLIITSEDTRALDQLEELMSRLAPPRKEYEVFHLKFAEAYWVKWNLEDFFKEEQKGGDSGNSYWAGYYGYPWSSNNAKDTSRRLSRRRPLKFVSDDDTNTILVQGADPGQLRTIKELIELYDQRHLTDSESARKTEVFHIRYSKARVVAEAVKEVYRDLLSSNDKSLVNNNRPQQQRHESRYTYIYGSVDGQDTERKAPRFKGYLSVGVDELSNTLVVSAPEFLFRDVEKMIEALDEAAKPVSTVRVVSLGQGVSAEGVRQALTEILGEPATGRRPSGRPPQQPGQGGPRPPNAERGQGSRNH